LPSTLPVVELAGVCGGVGLGSTALEFPAVRDGRFPRVGVGLLLTTPGTWLCARDAWVAMDELESDLAGEEGLAAPDRVGTADADGEGDGRTGWWTLPNGLALADVVADVGVGVGVVWAEDDVVPVSVGGAGAGVG
jgi:hypothetical protein